MSNVFLKELTELVSNGIINNETAEKIRQYYTKKEIESPNRLFVIFGVLGAVLGGLGIILILAHNWDNFSTSVKSTFSFFPLILGQLFCLYSILYKKDSKVWTESSATFLLFAIAASISLVAQVYNIQGEFKNFLLTWILLSLPMVYIMHSSFVSLLCVLGITWYGCITNYGYPKENGWYHWILFSTLLPHYKEQIINFPKQNFTRFHHWFYAIAALICLPTISNKDNGILAIGFISMLTIFYLIGKNDYFNKNSQQRNTYWLIGKLGILIMFFSFSFKAIWNDLLQANFSLLTIDSYIYLMLFIVCILIYIKSYIKRRLIDQNPIGLGFIIITILYSINQIMSYSIAVTVINLYILLIGVFEIKKGSEFNNIYKLNFGLLTISTLIICRFFDTEMSFIVRGILFLIIGIGFFALNYYLIRKKKNDEI